MKKIVITGIIVIAALAGIVYVLNKHKAENTAQTEIVAQKNSFVAVRVETADFREINGEYIANGTFAPQQEVKISAETSGLVTKVLVNEGSRVAAGQTLAVIKSDQQNVNVANAQAMYNNAQTEESEEHTSELQSRPHLVCRLLLEKKNSSGAHSQST